MHPDVSQLFDLTGKVALVTGGARDLGFDAASILAAAGCHVAITSRARDSATGPARALAERYGVDTAAFALDQTRFGNVARLAAEVYEWKEHIDILVNNA